jgi:glycosyltransferase involved in cell wall biosynthesis
MKPKLSVIMPMYNEKNIASNIKQSIKIFDTFKIPYEIIIVDDGSKINSFQEAKKIKSNKVKVVGYKENKGKGFAIKYGFKFTKGEYIAFIDSDLDLNPKQLKDFIEIMQKEKADAVIGSKRHPQSKVNYPIPRKIMSWAYQILIKILFNLNVTETQVGLKLFKRKVLEDIFPRVIIKRFAFDLEWLVNANKLGYKIVEAPIELNFKFTSTINPKAVFYMLQDTAAIFYRLNIIHYYDR